MPVRTPHATTPDASSEYYDQPDYLNTGECRLWRTVLMHIIRDYERSLGRIAAKSKRGPVLSYYRYAIDWTRIFVGQEWFAEICELSCVNPQAVIRQLNKLDLQYDFAAATFDDAPGFRSEWQLAEMEKRLC